MRKLFTLLLCLLSISGVQTIKAADEIYIVPSDDKKTLTMYYDDQCLARHGWTNWQKREMLYEQLVLQGEWDKYTTTVILDVSMKKARPTSTSEWFSDFYKLAVIEHLDYLNTSNVTGMAGMFYCCYELTNLDVSKFNTSNVTDMSGMFLNCEKLISLDVSKFNTSNVTDMSEMFYGCSGLTSLDVSKFNTSNVSDMSGMFLSCKKLTSLDISKWNTSNVTDMSGMFLSCKKLTSLDISKFNTSNVTDMSSMFSGCSGLTSLDVSDFNTSNVTDMSGMFSGCSGLTSLDVSKFNTSNVTDMSEMFYRCSGLNSLDLLNFDSKKVERIDSLFKDCENLITIYCKEDMTSLPTEYIVDYGNGITKTFLNDNLFTNCNKLVGANGTAYSSEHTGLEYARPDKNGQPGYFSTEAKDINKELTGLFTINSEGKQIVFSKGNLQYKASINEWRFAANQYAIIGEANANIAANYNGWIDLFGWGTGNNPTLASTNSAAYATFTDWGTNTISNGGTYAWRTLTMDEWDYIINQRPANKRGPAIVAGINGFVLLPDEWTTPFGIGFDPAATKPEGNTYTAEQWQKMEEAGAVFLPCAGMRSDKETNTTINHSNTVGIYWSSTPNTTGDPSHENYAQSVYIMNQYIIDNWNPYSNGLSVRLVREVWGEGIEDVQGDKAQSTKVIRDGVLLIERNGKTYNAQGAEVK